MATAIVNPITQRRVIVPDNWERVFPRLVRAGAYAPNRYHYNEDSLTPNVWVERSVGGLGDLIHVHPAVQQKAEQLVDKGVELHFACPELYTFLFRGMPHVRVISLNDPASARHVSIVKQYREYYDLVCPYSEYETSVKSDPKYGRLEIFHRWLGLTEFRNPDLRPAVRPVTDPWGDGPPVVGLGLQSADAMRDWSISRWMELAAALSAHGFRVVTIDQRKHTAYPSIVGAPLPDVMALISHMDFFIGLDSGLTYMAGGLGVPTLGLYGPTNPEVLCAHYPTISHVWADKPSGMGEQRPCYNTPNRGCNCRLHPGKGGTVGALCMGDISVRLAREAFFLMIENLSNGEKKCQIKTSQL